MGSPFTTTAAPATAVIPATDAQITKAILPAIESKAWRTVTGQDAYVSRVAVLNLAIGWAMAPMADETPAEISRVINGTVGRLSTYGERVNAILAHCAAQAPADSTVWKPLTKAGASALITWLFELPAVGGTAAPKADAGSDSYPTAEVVPAGRYAVEITDSTVGNDLAFYKVDRPTEGRWAGFVFVKQVVGPEERDVRGPAKLTILRQIAADAPAASIRYGHAVERCGVCHTRLTNKASREAGIGPDCRKKYGW